MAVIRDMLITQFFVYGTQMLGKQFDDLNRTMQFNNLERMKNSMKGIGGGGLRLVRQEAEQLNAVFGATGKFASRLQKFVAGTQGKGKYIISQSMLKDIQKFELMTGTKGLITQTAAYSAIQNSIKTKTAQTVEQAIRLKDVVDRATTSVVKFNRTAMITATSLNVLKGVALGLLPAIFLIGRSMYNVSENLRSAYIASIETGMGFEKMLSASRLFSAYGYDISVFSQAIEKVSTSLLTSKDAFRYLYAWLEIPPQTLLNKQPIEVVEMLLDKLNKLPDIAKRNVIANELLGSSWKDLMFYKEIGIFDTIKNQDRLAVMETKQLKRIIEINKKWAEMKVNVQSIGDTLTSAIVPALEMLTRFVELLTRNQQLFYSLLTVAGAALMIGGKTISSRIAGGLILGTGISGIITALSNNSNEQVSQLTRQTNLLENMYRSMSGLRQDLNRVLLTTARQVPDLYQASIYRSIIINSAGF